jgi:hypothetical protein
LVEQHENNSEFQNIDTNLFLDISKGVKAHTPDEAIAAAATWLVTGSSVKTEKLTGIPAPTIRYWYAQPWWKELVKVIRYAKQEELDAKLTGIIMDAAEQIHDRVQNGDVVLNPDTHEMDRIPMKGVDLSKVLGIHYDKRSMLRANPLDKAQNKQQGSIESTLKRLADQFEAMSRQASMKVIEGEVVHEA